MVFAGIIGAPVLWLAALQTGYTLSYQACDARSTSWVAVPTFSALAIVAGVAIVCAMAQQRARRDRRPLPLLGAIALGLAVLMTIVLIASALAPVMLHPCD
jgi:hypothetical protein